MWRRLLIQIVGAILVAVLSFLTGQQWQPAPQPEPRPRPRPFREEPAAPLPAAPEATDPDQVVRQAGHQDETLRHDRGWF